MTFNEKPFTVAEVAAKLRIDQDSVYRLLTRGKLLGFKPAGEWRIWPDDVAAYLQSKCNRPQDRQAERDRRMSQRELDAGLAAMGYKARQ